MSSTTAETKDVLNEDNYFAWELNVRMKLAKKGLQEHIDATKAPSEGDANASIWKVNDMNAFANECTVISPSLQSMVRDAGTTAEAWEILKAFFSIEAFIIGYRCVDSCTSIRCRREEV